MGVRCPFVRTDRSPGKAPRLPGCCTVETGSGNTSPFCSATRATHGRRTGAARRTGYRQDDLLADVVDDAEGMFVLRTQGIESEAPLAFAALQRLLRPAMRYAARLPAPQRSALRAAFGETAGVPGDRFLIFLAALSVLAEAAEDDPVLCVIDDAHWLDDASAAALLFVARRLGPERVALLFAARDRDLHGFDSTDLPELIVGGLDAASATRVLAELTGENVSPDVLDRLMAQTGGNPLALVELPTAMTSAQIRGEERLPAELSLTVGVQRVFLDRSRRLSTAAQTVLCVAAADDSTRVAVVRQAAALLGADSGAFAEAEGAGLIKIVGAEIRFRHPLVRSAVYQGAPTSPAETVARGAGEGDDRRRGRGPSGLAPRRGDRRTRRDRGRRIGSGRRPGAGEGRL